jgi:hypothetical protein
VYKTLKFNESGEPERNEGKIRIFDTSQTEITVSDTKLGPVDAAV